MQEIIINTNKENITTISLIENGNLLEKYEEKKEQNRLEGNIYYGRIQNVLQGMQAAFVDIGESKNTFIHLKDLMPKIDITKKKQEDLSDKNIKEMVKSGSKVLVQVKRDSTNNKGARVSSHISLVSRFFVLMPDTDIITLSQKIENEKEKQRLIDIIKKHLPNNMGIIVRTSSNGKNEEELKKDLDYIIKRWNEIQKKVNEYKSDKPILLEKNDGIIKKIIIDIVDNLSTISVNNENIYNEVTNIIKQFGKEKEIKIILKKQDDILDIYEINSQLEKLKNRKIWLKCGGFITIDKTEALTAIDVNTGKYTGTKNLEQTVLKVNIEASEEIAKQLRLRDIGGIIIIDYIDMQNDDSKKKVIEVLQENLKKDRSKTQILEFTKLNLLEMTRKHMFSND